MGCYQYHGTGHRGVIQRGDPEGKVEAQEKAGEKKPSPFVPRPSPPWSFVTSEGHQHEGGERHPVGSDDQHRRIAQLDEDRSSGDRHDSNAKEDDETDHLD